MCTSVFGGGVKARRCIKTLRPSHRGYLIHQEDSPDVPCPRGSSSNAEKRAGIEVFPPNRVYVLESGGGA